MSWEIQQQIDRNNSNSIDREELDVAAKEWWFLSKEENLVAIAKQLEWEQKDTCVQSFQECLSTAYKDIQNKTEKTENDMAIVRVVEQIQKMGVSIVDTKELYKENHYEYKSSKLYLNNNPVDIQTMPILGNQEILEEMYKEKLAKFEIIWSIVEKFAMALQIQDSERMFNREQKPVIENKIKKLEYILQQKEQYSSWAMLTYTDTKAFNAQIQSSLSEIFDTELLNVNNYGPIYEKIKSSCEEVLRSGEKTNKDDGILKSFADIKWDIVIEIRKLTWRKNSEDMLLPDLEDYILQNKKLKDLWYSNKVFRRNASTKQWEDKYTKNYVIETPVAHTFDLFNNIIKPQFEEDNNTKIVDDFIVASKTPSKIPGFLSNLRNQKFTSDLSKWENLPANFKANLVKYTVTYGKKFQDKLEEQHEEIKKNVRKTIGGQMYIEYLQTTAPQEKKDLLLQKNKEKLIKIVESVSDTYEQYGSFRKLRSDDTTNALIGIENNRKKNGILQNEEQKIEDIYKATERQWAYKVLKSAIVRWAIETYQTEITGKDDFWLHKEKFAAAWVADFMAKWYALQKRGEDILMVPIAPDDEKIKTYMDIIGVGALNFSDKTVDEIVKRSKELAIQIALMAISWWLANIATKWLMYLGAATIGKFWATTVAESIVMYYTERAALNRWTKMAIGAVDLATEWSLFHMFNTVLWGTVNGQSWTEMSKELKNVSGYISSIAFIGVMKMYGSLGQLATKSISDSKIVSQWIKNGTITQDQLRNVIQTFSVPLEVGTMTMTEITINFTEAAITGEEIRPIDLTNTIAIVLGLRMAHAGGNLFKKGEEIIIESMKKNKETGEWDISFRTKNTIKVDTEAVNTADVEMKNKQAEQTKMKEKEIIRVNNLLQKPFTGITLQDRHDMWFKQQREYIKKNELWKDKTLSSEEVNKKQKLEDLTVEEFGILIERIVEKKWEVNGDIVSENIIANKDWSILTISQIKELYIKWETAKTELWNLLQSKALTKQEYIKQLQILEKEYPTIADITSAKERDIIKKYGYEISKEKIQDYIQKLWVDIQWWGSNAQWVHEIMETNLVAVIKSEWSFVYELPQKSLMNWLTTSRVPRIVDVFLYEGKTYKIMERSPGKSVEKLSLEEIKNIPQEHYDNYVRDLKELETVGLQVDPSKASNVFYDKETWFHFIDLGIKESTISMFDNIKNLQLGKWILNWEQIKIAKQNAEYEKVFYKVYQTIFTEIQNNKPYTLETVELNWCTAATVLITNKEWKKFALSTHFPPISNFSEQQLSQIHKFLQTNKSKIGDIASVEMFAVTDVWRKNNDYQKIVDAIQQETSIQPNMHLSEYNSRDKSRANTEDLGKMNIKIDKEGNIKFIHEGKKVIQTELKDDNKKKETTRRSAVDKKIVEKNAALEDWPRLQTAEKLLSLSSWSLIDVKGKFTEKWQAILDAHNQPWEIYNLNFSQIKARTEILKKAGFTSEQVSVLMENGICGQYDISFKSEIDWTKYNHEMSQVLIDEYLNIEMKAKSDGTWMKRDRDYDVFNRIDEINLTGLKEKLKNNEINSKDIPLCEHLIADLENKKIASVTYPDSPYEFIIERSSALKKAYPNGFNKTYRGSSYQNSFKGSLTDDNTKGVIFTADKKSAIHYASESNKIFTHETDVWPGIHVLYYPKSKNILEIDAKWVGWRDIDLPWLGKMSTDNIAKYIEDNNIDYVKITNVFDGLPIKEEIMFNHKKGNYLKSAIGNTGFFDMGNPNIYK